MKQYLIISIIILLFAFSSCNSSSEKTIVNDSNLNKIESEAIEHEELPELFYRHYSGAIEGIEIELSLNKNKTHLFGYYYYHNIKQNIYLEGTIDNENNIEIKEYLDHDKITGTFVGKIQGDKIIGTWKNATKELDFTLTEDYSNSLKFANYNRTENYKMFGVDTFPEYDIELNTIYPVDENGKALTKLNDIILNFYYQDSIVTSSPTETFDNYVNYLIESYKDICEQGVTDYEEIIDDFYMYRWSYSSYWHIILNDNDLLCISLQFDDYTGGAHGYYSSHFLTIDTKEEKRLKIEDIFDKKDYEELRQLIINKIEEDGRLEELFSIEDVTVTDNFYLDLSGIGFVYNPYEIGPYSSGVFEVYITFEEIKHIIKSSFSF